MNVQLDRTYAPSGIQTSALAPVFSASLFTSAALLFWIQPLVAKMLLPLLGGAPSVWNTCMVFFQALLLAGYAYALILSQKLSLRNQALLHLVLLVAAGMVLPFSLSSRILSTLPTQTSPIPWLLGALLVIAGPPFFLLSATAPLLQRWFSHSGHKSAHDPYFLYAVSNAGSMLALLAFPFLLEPALAIRTQSMSWAFGYAGLVALTLGCAVLVKGRKATLPESTIIGAVEPLASKLRLQWVLLSFVPSSLMVGVTTYIATDVASVPLIWIIPLTSYLLTFILAFSNKQVISLGLASHLLPVAIVCLGAFMIFKPRLSEWLAIALHLVVFFLIAFICHRRLVVSRPPVSKLPEYYLWIAVGGVLGGIFNALLAPMIFSTPLEYPILIVVGCTLRPASEVMTRSRWIIAFPSALLILTVLLAVFIPRLEFPERLQNGLVLFLPLILCYAFSFRSPVVFALSLLALMLGARPYLNAAVQTLTTERNFFGVWRVTINPNDDLRRLYHGSTVHGLQSKDETQECVPTSYYHRDGPLGQIFDVYKGKPGKPVSVTGLGAGTIGTYSSREQEWDFYDIDPAIVRLASDPGNFTFLSNCTAASYRIILGDARLQLRNAAPGRYGLFVMDAFSSDSVPAHLLTIEALDLYLSKVAPDGLLAFHISNRYLDLEPLLSGLAGRARLSAFIRRDEERSVSGRYPSIWVVLARSDNDLGLIPSDPRWRRLVGKVVWTDDFSNILSVLK